MKHPIYPNQQKVISVPEVKIIKKKYSSTLFNGYDMSQRSTTMTGIHCLYWRGKEHILKIGHAQTKEIQAKKM